MQEISITNPKEYQQYEKRLIEIKDKLEAISKEESIDLSEVVTLRDEARAIAIALKNFLKITFEK
ncbi:MAG: hypothetical protein KU29_09730 [Sulfurovum sp. FS06-10]|nr:MAG: hypothetical protein KU29_09730 [Sulfurovum sp. FS06-10]